MSMRISHAEHVRLVMVASIHAMKIQKISNSNIVICEPKKFSEPISKI